MAKQTDARYLDLESGGPQVWAEAMARATRMGACDANTKRNLTGRKLAGKICTAWRIGDERALRHAYSYGKWRAEVPEFDRKEQARKAREEVE